MGKMKALLKNKKIFRFVYSIVCAVVLFMVMNSMTIIKQNITEAGEKQTTFTFDANRMAFLYAAIFFFMFLSGLLLIVSGEHRDQAGKIKNRVCCLIFLSAVPILLFLDDREMALRMAFNLYFASIIVGKTISTALKLKNKKKRVRNIFKLLVLYFVLDLVVTVNMEVEHRVYAFMVYMCGMFLMFRYLIEIIVKTFSGVKLDVLRKIIKKTFTAEILSGFLVLIFAVASVLKNYEPGIKTMGDALWYCFALVTTIGFGDFTVVTTLGRMLSVLLGIYGIIVVSLITSIIVNFYSEIKDKDDEEDEDEDEGDDGDDSGEGKEDDSGKTEALVKTKKTKATRVGGMTITSPEQDEDKTENDD